MTLPGAQAHTREDNKTRVLNLAGLAAIVLLAAGLRFSNLDALGLANHYYAAAVQSMLESWHNFFFVAAEPGASVSVDKPPVGLWLQAVSARLFGVNTLGLLLPQLLAGILSVVLLYHLVKRRFGAPAGLLAALALGITPVVVATDRNNTMDSTLIFTLLLAAWAFIKATESTRLKYLLWGGLLVGVAFNIKMLEAYLPLPAFFALYLLGAKEGWGRKLGKLVLTSFVLMAVSLSWVLAVDLTPADQRPYVGSSGDNSELSLVTGYNGLARLLGMNAGGNSRQTSRNLPQPGGRQQPFNDGFQGGGFPGGNFQPGPPNNPNQSGLPGGAAPAASPAAGFSSTGQAGVLRLFIPPLSKEASWLLPLGLFCLALLIFSRRLSWPITGQHQAVILWGGWLLTTGIFFSMAGFFHEYYLSTLAPPLAALVGIGVAKAWTMRKQHAWLSSILLVAASVLTLLLQYNTARDFVESGPWLPWVLGILALGVVLVLLGSLLPRAITPHLAKLGFVCLILSMLITPAVWSALTSLHASSNQSLPAAYDGTSSTLAYHGQVNVDQALLSYLQANTGGVYYLMAVPSSMQGADYVLATGRPVLYMGGFMGQDEVLTPDGLASLVDSGKLRFIYWNTAGDGRPGGGAFGGQSLISGWVTSNCQVVNGYGTVTSNFGAPDGLNSGAGNSGFRPAAQAVTLYDCGN